MGDSGGFGVCFFISKSSGHLKKKLPNSLPREGGSFAQGWKSGEVERPGALESAPAHSCHKQTMLA